MADDRHEYAITYTSTNGENAHTNTTTILASDASSAEQILRKWFAKEYRYYTITSLTCEQLPDEEF